VGTPSIASVGDSAISGEARRWAGNTNNRPSQVDALGSTAYADEGDAEAIPENTVRPLEEKGVANWTSTANGLNAQGEPNMALN
jgi:hypothetical protein